MKRSVVRMRKRKMVFLVGGMLVTTLFLMYLMRDERSDSVHGLNWEYYEEMGAHVSEMTLNIPPGFMGQWMNTDHDLTVFFQSFYENLDMVRDFPLVPGQTLTSDFEVVVKFTGLTGDENFLGGRDISDGTLELSFYVDASLAQATLDLRNVATEAYNILRDPSWEAVRITLAEVDWDALREDYSSHVSIIVIQGASREDGHFNMTDFMTGRDDLSVVLEFLEDNQDEFRSVEDSEYTYQGTIHFWVEDGEPRQMSPFFMDEDLNRRLMSAIGEEAWEAARR